MLARILSVLESRKAPWLLAALALLLSLPSLRFGLQSDDHMQAVNFEQRGLGPHQMLQAPPERLVEMREVGLLSWWTSPRLTIQFLRPLSSLTHWVEFSLWPSSPWAMHLLSALIYALCVAVAAACYRELLAERTIAALAGLMFAIDGTHALSVGWISSRNTVLATLFALLSVWLHVRARQRERVAFAAAGCTALALASAEFGTGVFAYLVAYACTLDRGTWRERLLALAPHAVVGAVWAIIYVSGEYGLRHGGWYRDPSSEGPLTVIGQGLADLPTWLFSLLGLTIGEVVVMWDANKARLLALCLLLPLLAWLVPVLRRSQHARFFALGALLSLAPLFTTYPQGRVLILASFGGLGWIACALQSVADPDTRFARAGRHVLRTLHVAIAPILFLMFVGSMKGIQGGADALLRAYPKQGGAEVVIVNSPLELLTQIAGSMRLRSNDPPLAATHQLYAGRSAVVVERIDERTLEVSAERGWGRVPIERLMSSRDDMPGLGASRDVFHMRATVMAVTRDGLPARVRFTFPDRLESPHRSWLMWEGREPARFELPAIGARRTLAAVSVLKLGT